MVSRRELASRLTLIGVLVALLVVPVVLQFRDVGFIALPAALLPLSTLLVQGWLLIAEQRGWRPPVGRVLLMAIVAGAVVAPVIGAGLEQMHFPGPAASVFLGPVKSALLGAFLGFTQVGLWALLAVVPRRERELLERELTVRRLEAESQQLRTMAELSELRSRLEPHFLLNTLNTAAAIVVRAPEDARDLLTALGELLSDSLLDQGPSRSLREEIEWTRRYLHILERRHSDRLRVRFALDETAMGLQVPSMMLQPLVENAVEHGVLCQREPSTVEISTHLDAGRLRCTIRNATAPRTAANGRGVGLTSLARRLSLFSSPATFQLNRGDSLTEAIVEIDYGVVRA